MRAVERARVGGTTGRARVDDRADGDGDGDECERDAHGDDVRAGGDQGDANDGDAREA